MPTSLTGRHRRRCCDHALPTQSPHDAHCRLPYAVVVGLGSTVCCSLPQRPSRTCGSNTLIGRIAAITAHGVGCAGYPSRNHSPRHRSSNSTRAGRARRLVRFLSRRTAHDTTSRHVVRRNCTGHTDTMLQMHYNARRRAARRRQSTRGRHHGTDPPGSGTHRIGRDKTGPSTTLSEATTTGDDPPPALRRSTHGA